MSPAFQIFGVGISVFIPYLAVTQCPSLSFNLWVSPECLAGIAVSWPMNEMNDAISMFNLHVCASEAL